MKSDKKKILMSILPSVVAVLAGLLLGWYLMFLTRPVDSFGGLVTILTGGLSDKAEGIGTLLYTATPIILTGMSVGCSIQTGLFNIGASGQLTAGGIAAILVACNVTDMPPVVITILAMLTGVFAGVLWGALSGALKAYFKVNEVISGIMLNYICMLIGNILIKTYAYNRTFNRSADIPKAVMLGDSLLGKMLPGSRISIIFFISIVTVLVIKFILDRTTFGYELKLTGKNKYAGIYAGINDKKNTILAMAICGALSGLAGALVYLSTFGDHISIVESVSPLGFTGISVALLGMSNPLGIIAAGLFIAHITVGGTYLQLFSYTPDVVNMIIGVIVFCGALVIPIRVFFEQLMKKRERAKKEAKV